jgi:hypothetical protein
VRNAADAEGIKRLARELGRAVAPGTRMYLTGGATVVLEGWRESTVDVDVRFEPGVKNMVDSGQVDPEKLRELFEGIEGQLYRFPAVDPASLRVAVESLARNS